MKTIARIWWLGVVSLLLVGSASAQTTFTISPESKMWIDGTSNKSDWTVYSKQIDGTLTLADLDGAAPALQGVQVTIPVSEVVSDKSVIMDKNMHNALEVEEFPEITYELVEATLVADESTDDLFVMNTVGNLTMHGVTNEIQMRVEGSTADDGTVRFAGSHELDMTEYDVKPPVAMFGAWRVAQDVVVNYELVATQGGAN